MLVELPGMREGRRKRKVEGRRERERESGRDWEKGKARGERR